MKIKLKNTPEQIELVKAIGSKNKIVASEAMEAMAAFIGPVIRKVLNAAGTAGMIYEDVEYDEDDSPSIPLDLYYNEGAGHVTVWQQSMAGGLPTNQVAGIDELKVATYRLDSAASMLKRYARRARLDVVGKTLSKMANEVLVKQERNAWAVILKALAEASTDSLSHILSAGTANTFQVDDLNRLMTRVRRINTSFNGGTPDNLDAQGLTDLFVSPEIVEQIRAFAYQPMNTRAVPNTDESTALPLPDSVRDEIFRNAGAQEIYGVNIHELLEFGDAKKYNTLFDTFYTGSFTGATDQIVVGIDMSRGAFVRLIERNADTGDTFVALPDDQFPSRADKVGWYGSLQEGRVCVDARAVAGLIV